MAHPSEPAISPRARALHSRSIVVDTHNDTAQRLVFGNFDLGERHADGAIDIPRMRDGGLDAAFFAIWVPSSITGRKAVERALDQIEAIRRQAALHPNDLMLARTAADVRRARAAGRIALLMGLEGGHMMNQDLAVLRQYASLGAGYMTLTHVGNTDWADASTDAPAHNGLTDFGRKVIAEMNRLGMIVDVSHASNKTVQDVLAVSKAPLLASHSCCRALCDSPRNLPDDLMKALTVKGGVVQINFHVGFLSQEFSDAMKARPEIGKEIDEETVRRCGDDQACKLLEWSRLIGESMAQGRLPRVEWTRITEHIGHAVKVAGVDHVGLGSDFDGAAMPCGMEDASRLPQITDALLQEGYSETDVEKILGGNTLRLMRDVESVAESMRGTIA